MNIDHGKSHWTPEELEKLRQAIRDIMSAEGRTQANISREADIPSSTLSQFLSDSYRGNIQGVARDISRWLDARNRERMVLHQAPPKPTFIATQTARTIMAGLTHAQVHGDISIVVGPPGVGKTEAIRQYEATTPRVVRVTASPAMSSLTAVMRAVLRAALIDTRGALAPNSRLELGERLRHHFGPGWLLCIDEAQFIGLDALEEIRSLYDAAECGLFLSGNPSVLTRIEGVKREAEYAQLYGRIGWRAVIKKGQDGDVLPVLETMGITDPDVLAVAKEIARKENLRVVVKSTRTALTLAAELKENLEPKHLRAAYRQLGGQ